MTSNLRTLLKLEYQNRFRFNTFSHEKDSKRKGRTIGMAVAFFILILVMAGYCFGISYGFGYMGMSYVVPGYALTITALVTLFFTFFKTNGVLFASKDYDMLMAFPIRTEVIITAKFLSMYLNNLIFSMVVMIPMAVGYMYWNSVDIMVILIWLVGILIAPLLPMAVAAIVGMVIAAIGSGFRHKVLVQMLLNILLFVGIFGISYIVQKNAMKDEELFFMMLADIGASISQVIHKIYPLSAWFDTAVQEQQMMSVILFVIVSMLVYGGFVFICGKYYRKINSALQSHHAASNYKVGTLKSSSLLMALAKKEGKRFFSSSVYMMNMGMGLILALIVSIASIFVGMDKIIDSMNIASIDVVKPILANIMPFAIAMMVNMCNTCSVSLSLEGKNLWIVQSLPISKKVLLQGKMLFNIMLVLPVSIICNIIFVMELRVDIVIVLLYFTFSVISVIFSTVWGMFVNLHFPNYQWENEVEVIKQGMSSMIGIFSGMIFYILMAVLVVFLSSIISGAVILVGFSILLGVLSIVFYKCCK